MEKCDLCIDRLRQGLRPACEESCCGGAIKVGPIEELELDVRKSIVKKLIFKGSGKLNPTRAYLGVPLRPRVLL